MSKAKTFYLRQPNTGLVVEAPSTDNAPVYLATWTGDASQYFEQHEQSDGYSILVNAGNGYVLNLVKRFPYDIITSERDGDINQFWKLNVDDVECAGQGFVLDGGSLKEGQTLVGEQPNGSQAQNFVAVYAPVSDKE